MRKNQVTRLGKAMEGIAPSTVSLTVNLLVDEYVIREAFASGTVKGSNSLFEAIKDGDAKQATHLLHDHLRVSLDQIRSWIHTT